MDLGRKLLEKESRRFDLSAKTVLARATLDRIAGDFASKKGDDLCAAVGVREGVTPCCAGQARASGPAA